MAILTVIVTPTQGFGELIRQTLAETGVYRPVFASTVDQALARLAETSPDLVILDADLPPQDLALLSNLLQVDRRDFPLLWIDGMDPAPPEPPAGLEPDARLPKPFYLPALLQTVNELLPEPAASETKISSPQHAEIPVVPELPEAEAPQDVAQQEAPAEQLAAAQKTPPAQPVPLRRPASEAPPWLEDVRRAAQYLTRLSLESSAQAALILRNGRLWAYAGQLPQSAARELAESVRRDWEISNGDRIALHSETSDLARFVKLEATETEYMIYATLLADGLVLALAFEAQVPFSQMRAQAGKLARALARPPTPETPALPGEKQPAPYTAAGPEARREVEPEAGPENGYEAYASAWELDEDEEDFPAGPLFPPELVPPPTPVGGKKTRSADVFEDWPFYGEDPFPEGLLSAVDRIEESGWQPETGPPAGPRSRWDESPLKAWIDEQAPAPEECPILYSLHFTCVLVPRLPGHALTGDLAARLEDWVRRINLAFGWRLEHLAVRPDYLLVISSVPPDTSPSALLREMRRQTSWLIFDDFPPLAHDNPSGDFWAPGSLLLTSSQPPPPGELRRFVAETRRLQGLDEEYPG